MNEQDNGQLVPDQNPGIINKQLSHKVWPWILAAIAIIIGYSIWFFAIKPWNENSGSFSNNPGTGQSAAKNKGFKSYSSRKYGFEFRYPEDWTVDQREGTVINLYRYSLTNPTKYDAMVTFTVVGPDSPKGPAGDGPTVVSSEKLTIGGKDAVRQIAAFGSNKQLQYEVKLDDKNVLKIQVYSYLKGSSGYEGSFDTFLDELVKTLSFTKKP